MWVSTPNLRIRWKPKTANRRQTPLSAICRWLHDFHAEKNDIVPATHYLYHFVRREKKQIVHSNTFDPSTDTQKQHFAYDKIH